MGVALARVVRGAREAVQGARQRPAEACFYAVGGLLAAGLVAQLTAIAGPLLPVSSRHGASAGAWTASAARLDVASIIAAHLFGSVANGNEPLGRSDLPMILVATFATTDPSRGMAVLKDDPAGAGRLYVVGAQLAGGNAVLREVRADSVVLERSGRLETIAFARPANALNLLGAPAVVMADSRTPEGGTGTEPITEIVLQQQAEAARQEEQIDTSVPGAVQKEIPNSSP